MVFFVTLHNFLIEWFITRKSGWATERRREIWENQTNPDSTNLCVFFWESLPCKYGFQVAFQNYINKINPWSKVYYDQVRWSWKGSITYSESQKSPFQDIILSFSWTLDYLHLDMDELSALQGWLQYQQNEALLPKKVI